MKTTVEISEAVLAQARRVARAERTTVRALIEEGLRKVIAARSRRSAFRLRDASYKGRGLRPELAGAPWETFRDAIYKGRSG